MPSSNSPPFSFSEWAKDDNELSTAVQALKDLPAMSDIISDFLFSVQDPDWTAKGVAAIIARDPAVTACVLKVANSSYYSFQRSVNSVEGAVAMLGLKTVKSLVLAASVKSINKRYGLVEKLLLEDAIGSALAARAIAKNTRMIDPEEAFLAGLLRHIGKIAMNNLEPVKYSAVMQAAYNEEGNLASLERKYFDYSHSAIGAAVLEKWNFSPQLVAATLFHAESTTPPQIGTETSQMIAVIGLADTICRKLGIGRRQAEDDHPVNESQALELGLDEAKLNEILEEVAKAFEETRDLFSGNA